MSQARTQRSNSARVNLPPSLLKPPIAIPGSPPVASSSDAAVCEPETAATQRKLEASLSNAFFSAALTFVIPPPPPALALDEPDGPNSCTPAGAAPGETLDAVPRAA